MKAITKIVLACRLWTDPSLGYTWRGALRTASAMMRATS